MQTAMEHISNNPTHSHRTSFSRPSVLSSHLKIYPACPLSTKARHLELVICIGTLACALAWLVWNGAVRSRLFYNTVPQFPPIIKPGWLPFSNGIDLTDMHWRKYRENLPFYLVVTLIPVLLRKRLVPATMTDAQRRVQYMVWWGLIFAAVLHGLGLIFLMLVLVLNYKVAQMVKGSRFARAWAWAYCLLILFLCKVRGNKYWQGMLTRWGLSLAAYEPTFRGIFGNLFGSLDGLKGFYSWVSPLNVTILRLISYNLDLHQQHVNCEEQVKDVSQRHQVVPVLIPWCSCSLTAQLAVFFVIFTIFEQDPFTLVLDDSAAGLHAVLSTTLSSAHIVRSEMQILNCDIQHMYIFYPPLYISGPILTYDSFLEQLRNKENEKGRPQRPELHAVMTEHLESSGQAMFLRALGYAVTLEVTLHYLYYHAVSHNLDVIFHKISKDVMYLPPWEIMLCGFFTLNFMYVKFLVIWRIATAIALIDGILTVDNMNRCVCNNYTFQGLWRSWHASLHKWVIRYMYIPLGGRATQMLTVGPIFWFIALWHDFELRWIAWATANTVCFLIEALVTNFVNARLSRLVEIHGVLWRYISAAAAVCNIYLLMLCNLAILYGFKGIYDFIRAFSDPPKAYSKWYEGLQCNVIGAWWLFCGVLLMFQVRERERMVGKIKRF